jgi:hypothetical protein
MKFRVIAEGGAYMSRSAEVALLEMGNDRALAKAFNIRGPLNELLPQGTEVEGIHIQAGPHLEAIDAEAEQAMAAYWRQHPGASLDPTRSLPLTGGFDSAVQGQLNRLLFEATTTVPPQQDVEVVALKQQLA